MKKTARYLFEIFIIGVSLIDSESKPNENHHNSFSDKMKGLITNRCLKHKDQGHNELVLNKFESALRCKEKLVPNESHKEDENIEKRCFSRRNEVLDCVTNLVEALKICLYPEESYLPDFINESFIAYTDYFCKNVRMLTFDELLETNTSYCINRFMKYAHTNPHKNCFENIGSADPVREEAITKAELCEDVDEIYSCYHRKYKQYCAYAPRAWEFESGLLNALQSPCYLN